MEIPISFNFTMPLPSKLDEDIFKELNVFDVVRKYEKKENAPKFDSDNLRVCKILGGDIEDS